MCQILKNVLAFSGAVTALLQFILSGVAYDRKIYPDFFLKTKMYIISYTLTGHFIRNSILILGRASLCSQNSLSSSWPGFHKMLKTFLWDSVPCWHDLHHTISADLSDTHSSCESPFLPHPKGVLLHSDPVTGKATEEHSCSWNQFEMTLALWHGELSCWK